MECACYSQLLVKIGTRLLNSQPSNWLKEAGYEPIAYFRAQNLAATNKVKKIVSNVRKKQNY